jgi:5-methylcytosine-specific restriction endonuclease McrA
MDFYYFLPNNLLEYLDKKNPNLGMYIRYECTKINEDIIQNLKKYPIELGRVIDRKKRYEVLKRQNWMCNNCGIKLKFNVDSKYGKVIGHIDHIHPYSKRDTYKNGSDKINEILNLQALCPKCNQSKFNKVIN